MCPNLSDPPVPTWRGKEDREAADDKSGAHHGCPCCVPGSRVLGLHATSDILDPAGPPLAARGSPRLPPGPLESYLSPNTVWIAWYILESLLYLVDIRNF